MAFKSIDSARAWWRAANAANLVVLVGADARCEKRTSPFGELHAAEEFESGVAAHRV